MPWIKDASERIVFPSVFHIWWLSGRHRVLSEATRARCRPPLIPAWPHAGQRHSKWDRPGPKTQRSVILLNKTCKVPNADNGRNSFSLAETVEQCRERSFVVVG